MLSSTPAPDFHLNQALFALSQTGNFTEVTPEQKQCLEQALYRTPLVLEILVLEKPPDHPGQISDKLAQQAKAWAKLLPKLQADWPMGLPPLDNYLALLWQLWLPVSLEMIAAQQHLERPLIQGIVGAQGAGKTTLCRLLQKILTALGHPTLSLSIDDFYKTYAERQALQAQDPRLIWRGPPGTHDVDLAISVLKQLCESPHTTTAIPRFDKTAHQGAGDRYSTPELTTGNEIILFEGWFIGARPIANDRFAQAPPPITTEADRQFARDMNINLRAYQPLWSQIDRLMVLDLVDNQSSYQWRTQAEQAALDRGDGGMSAAQVNDFVTYFWRALHPELFIKPLTQPRSVQPPVHLVVEIQPDHQPGRVYCPPVPAPGEY
jgi:D-glycerate 3-kinase